MTLGKSGLLLCAAALLFGTMPAADAAKTKSSGGPPVIDLQKRCRNSANAVSEMMGDISQKGAAFETCMRAEQDARKALQAAWGDMPEAYKSFCIRPADYSPSYVEWIACVEMMIDVKKLRSNAGTDRKPTDRKPTDRKP